MSRMEETTLGDVKKYLDKDLVKVILDWANANGNKSSMVIYATLAAMLGNHAGLDCDTIEELGQFVKSLSVIMAEAAALALARKRERNGEVGDIPGAGSRHH